MSVHASKQKQDGGYPCMHATRRLRAGSRHRSVALLLGHTHRRAGQLLGHADKLLQKGRRAEAIDVYEQVLKMRPAETHPQSIGVVGDLGMLYAQTGRRTEALKYLQLSVDLHRKHRETYLHQALYNLAFALQNFGQMSRSLALYEEALSHKPDFYDAIIKAAYVCNVMGQVNKVVTLLRRAIRVQPKDPGPYMYLADTLNNRKRWEEAVALYRRVLDMPHAAAKHAEAHCSLADTLSNMMQPLDAQRHYKLSLKLNPRAPPAIIGLWRVSAALADWSNWDALVGKVAALTKQEVAQGRPPSLAPYDMFYFPESVLPLALRRRATSLWIAATVRGVPKTARPKLTFVSGGSSQARLHVAYISRRFERYPGTQLMLRVFRTHDRSKVRVSAFAHGPDDGSDERRTVERDADHFHDVSLLSPAQVAQKIRQSKVDILIDYDGCHAFNNLAVLAHSPAPVTLSWLGFAGHCHMSGVVDYVVADRTVIPPNITAEAAAALYLPDSFSYQPQDPLQPIDEHAAVAAQFTPPWTPDTTAAAAGDSTVDGPFVLACFLRVDKIDPVVFDLWMEILERAPNTVLWLHSSSNTSAANLRERANRRGIDVQRRLFFRHERVAKARHLALHRFAHLFLDTLHYGGHTSTTDALWAGVPVLTALWQSPFSSRVAASVLRAAALPSLVAPSLQAYVDRAVELATHVDKYTELRQRVQRLREVAVARTASSSWLDAKPSAEAQASDAGDGSCSGGSCQTGCDSGRATATSATASPDASLFDIERFVRRGLEPTLFALVEKLRSTPS